MLTTQFMTLYTNDFADRFAKYVSGGYDLETALDNCISDYEEDEIMVYKTLEDREKFKHILRMELSSRIANEETILAYKN